MSSLGLPLLFAELNKPSTWTQVEFVFPDTPLKGECVIESNGPFLYIKPKSKIPPFFLFIGNYTPLPHPDRPVVTLQHMQKPGTRQELIFKDPTKRNEFITAFFESLAALQAFISNADMLDFCRSDQFQAVLAGQSKPAEIMCVLQSNGKNSVIQGHVIENGKVKPGFSSSITTSTMVAPVVSIPEGLRKVLGVTEKAFAMGDVGNKQGPDVVIVCGNSQEMMTWVLSIYLAIAVSGRKITRKNTAEVVERNAEVPLEISAEDIDLPKKVYDMKFPESEDISVSQLLTKYGVAEPSGVTCPFVEDLKNSNGQRQVVLLALMFANGIRDRETFRKVVEKTPAAEIAANLDGKFEKQVSVFVSTCLHEKKMQAVLNALSDEKSVCEFYEIGALIRFPGLCSVIANLVSDIECEVCESLLDNLSFDDECRYLRSSSFMFLNIVNSASRHLVKGILEQLEDGMIYPALKMTTGPWTLIGDWVSSGKASEGLAEAYQWINNSHIYDERRVCASKIEELIFEGINKDLICDWLKELNQQKDQLSKYYKSDATLCDSTRVAFVVNYIQNQMEQLLSN